MKDAATDHVGRALWAQDESSTDIPQNHCLGSVAGEEMKSQFGSHSPESARRGRTEGMCFLNPIESEVWAASSRPVKLRPASLRLVLSRFIHPGSTRALVARGEFFQVPPNPFAPGIV